ncbi:S26 family signal peptidase [Agrobacterium tumefaciens]|uniref:S26 family signal peptidase n=1 Tax=Agrobacterium tumefaciens TaxID=358 RepID=UPI001572BE63|nr:S26 family signal peptidase [Agrobacterium tumefaciens]UXT20429.1 S26 family signal peptidase [Agrobacterium tumefaciens]WHO20779.1 S26 family signal peptidase [Agrobacterium tumefaciens]WHO23564.1 S26 family signal peptidase [Agrobacterium tumefaciens]
MTRARYLVVMAAGVLGIALSSIVPIAPILVWNASASVPVGFYTITRSEPVEITDLVAVMPPKPLADFMIERGYIGRDVPLLKRVLALPGQQVCRIGRDILIDGIGVGSALARDRLGRELPVWQGCRPIAAGELFLMNPDARDSLDGRYFGTLPASVVIGVATSLYTDEDGDGRFVWCAPKR